MLCAALFFAACGGGTVEPNEPTPTPNPQPEQTEPIVIPSSENLQPSFDVNGGSATVSFTANADWVATVINTRADSWCTVQPNSGTKGSNTITIKVASNDTPDSRTAVVQLVSGTTAKNINVSQKQKDALSLTTNRFEVAKEGGLVEIEIMANVDVSYSIDDKAKEWVSYIGTRALKSSIMTFKVTANNSSEKREATITLSNGNLEEKVTIYQESGESAAIVISKSEYTVGSDGETIQVEVASNVDVEVVMPDADWIKENTTRAMSTHTYYYIVSPNENPDSREAEIIFRNKANNLEERVKVVQAGKTSFGISKTSVEVGAEKSTFDLVITSSIGYEVKPQVDWIKQTSATGEKGVYTHTFEVSENLSNESREGVIVVCNDNQVCIPVTVKQSGVNLYLDIVQSEYSVGADGQTIKVEVSSNVDVEVVLPDVDWITKDETKTRAMANFYFVVAPNESSQERSAEIIFRNLEKNLSKTVKVLQSGKTLFNISSTAIEVGAEKSTFDLVITSSIGYEVKPEADWIKQLSVAGNDGVYTHKFEVSANSSEDARQGVIVVCNDEQVCIPVTVKQAGAEPEEEDMSWVDKEFYHRSLAMRFTADWCGYCPTVAANMAEFERLYPDKVEMVHMHCDGNLKFSGAQPLMNLCDVTGYPTGIFDMRGDFYSTSSIKKQLDKTEQNYPTQTGVSYTSTLNGNNLELDLKIYAKAADNYKVTVLLLEDDIVGYQADYNYGTHYDYVHSGVVRMALTNILGDDCTTNQENQIVKKSYNISIPTKYKTENMRVLVYVQRPYGNQSLIDNTSYGDYYVDNSVSGKLGSDLKLVLIENLWGGGNEDILPDEDIDF